MNKCLNRNPRSGLSAKCQVRRVIDNEIMALTKTLGFAMQRSNYEIGVEAMKFWFWFLWAIDAFIAAVVLYFFFSLAGHGRIASFNILPWLVILAILGAVVGGSVWLRSAGQRGLALVLLLLLAIPGAIYVLFFLLLLILHPNFR